MRRLLVGLIIVGVVGVAAQLTAQKPVVSGRAICVPYDPAPLKLTEMQQTGTWMLLEEPVNFVSRVIDEGHFVEFVGD